MIPLIDINEFQSNESQYYVIQDSQVANTFNPQLQSNSIKDEVMRDIRISDIQDQRKSSLADQFQDLYQKQEQKYQNTVESEIYYGQDTSYLNKKVNFTEEDEYFNESDEENQKGLNQYKKQTNDSVQDEEKANPEQVLFSGGKVKKHLFQTPQKESDFSYSEEVPKIPYLQKTHLFDPNRVSSSQQLIQPQSQQYPTHNQNFAQSQQQSVQVMGNPL